MGILNLTPDSFYPASRVQRPDEAVARARAMAAEGADLLDLGAESSRPGSRPLSPAEEQERLLPVLEALAEEKDLPPVSVDSWHADTVRAALARGAAVVNDISAVSFDPGLLEVVAEARPGYVLMHCQGRPETMQRAPRYDDVLSEVTAFFEAGLERLTRAGLPEEHIILDPGIGFGKRMEHNLALMAHPEAWAHLGRPTLMALSMKSVFQDLLGLPVEARGPATQVATALTYLKGCRWHRVHDVAGTRRALALAAALSSPS